jgi:hypothetical protein
MDIRLIHVIVVIRRKYHPNLNIVPLDVVMVVIMLLMMMSNMDLYHLVDPWMQCWKKEMMIWMVSF